MATSDRLWLLLLSWCSAVAAAAACPSPPKNELGPTCPWLGVTWANFGPKPVFFGDLLFAALEESVVKHRVFATSLLSAHVLGVQNLAHTYVLKTLAIPWLLFQAVKKNMPIPWSWAVDSQKPWSLHSVMLHDVGPILRRHGPRTAAKSKPAWM